jgi:hypothetical protein
MGDNEVMIALSLNWQRQCDRLTGDKKATTHIVGKSINK